MDRDFSLFELATCLREDFIHRLELICYFVAVAAYLLAELLRGHTRGNFQFEARSRNSVHNSQAHLGRFELVAALSLACEEHGLALEQSWGASETC